MPYDDPAVPDIFPYDTIGLSKNSITMMLMPHFNQCIHFHVQSQCFLQVLWLCKVMARWPDLVFSMSDTSICSFIDPFWRGGLLFSCDQAALWMVQSVRLSVCLSVCDAFLPLSPLGWRGIVVTVRAGGRLPDLRIPYLCNRLMDFLRSKFYGIV